MIPEVQKIIDQYLMSSQHSNQALVNRLKMADLPRISTDNSIPTNFGKRAEHIL